MLNKNYQMNIFPETFLKIVSETDNISSQHLENAELKC